MPTRAWPRAGSTCPPYSRFFLGCSIPPLRDGRDHAVEELRACRNGAGELEGRVRKLYIESRSGGTEGVLPSRGARSRDGGREGVEAGQEERGVGLGCLVKAVLTLE